MPRRPFRGYRKRKSVNLLVKIPTRERKDQFFSVLNKAQRNRTHPNTRFLITLDTNDTVMNSEAAKRVLGMWGNLTYVYGESKSKIDAVNRDMDQAPDWDILLLLSDDMHIVQTGYDSIIIDHFKNLIPDTDGALWLNDGHTKKTLNTIVCIGRKRYERFGYLYAPVYKSLFADNEYTDVNKKLGNFHYVEQVLIEHRHPMNTPRTTPMDSLYRRNDAHFMSDRRLYFYRKDKVFV